jgi:hypothetical protein
MVGRNRITLHIYWEDGVTIELRYFPTKKAAKTYAAKNDCVNYLID